MSTTTRNLRVAIVHDQLTQYGGAERTLEQLLAIFPTADIYTGYCKPYNISQKILARRIFSGHGVFRCMSFLMPFVFEGFDLRKYDIIISEGTAWPKGVITAPEQLHVSYMYTPPRFLYGYATEGQKRDLWYYKPFLKVIDHLLRLWDFSAAQRPDFILSISQEVAKRVQKFYRRDSTIIYPPVDITGMGVAFDVHKKTPRSVFSLDSTQPHNNDSQLLSNPTEPRASQAVPYGSRLRVSTDTVSEYYLCISRLAAYKNIDLLIHAFNKTHLKLKIAGTGKEEASLKAIAHDGVELLGFVDEEEKNELLTNCKGFIFPTDYEDFGIVVVEALAHGKPVLCHRSGGPLEIIENGLPAQAGVTGMFFDELDAETLSKTITQFDKNIDAGVYNDQKAKESARKFSAERFNQEFGDFVKQRWEEKQNARTT